MPGEPQDAQLFRKEITVDLGERSYPIIIGDDVINEIGEHLVGKFPGSRAVIVSDTNVDDLHGPAVRRSLDASDVRHDSLVIPAGEKSKSFGTLQYVVDGILASGMERGDVLIALGGGVVGDLAGFAAGIVRRGMPFIQVPTSLLAQVDSSVGGKTGINSDRGKNLVGLFNQPAVVLADTDVLNTLPERELKAGYAEIVKYGLINKPDFFEWLEYNHAEIFAGGQARVQAIATSCQAKAEVVKADEFEQDSRALLNLGHTFGHALEAVVGYNADRLVHGEAVAIGLVLAHEFSHMLNQCGPDDAMRVKRHLEFVGLPTSIDQVPGSSFSVDGLMQAIMQDKKIQRGMLTFILTKGIGQSYVAKDVPRNLVEEFLSTKLAD